MKMVATLNLVLRSTSVIRTEWPCLPITVKLDNAIHKDLGAVDPSKIKVIGPVISVQKKALIVVAKINLIKPYYSCNYS
tara:strand:+ start:431 stop:667 length:237 start_codon:yes stop_codon:yes gene_type:complete